MTGHEINPVWQKIMHEQLNAYFQTLEPMTGQAVMRFILSQDNHSPTQYRISSYLGIDEGQVEGITAKIIELGFARKEIPKNCSPATPQVKLTPEGTGYAGESIHQLWRSLPQWQHLSKEEASVLLSAVIPAFDITYTRHVNIPSSEAVEIARTLDPQIEAILQEQDRLVRELFARHTSVPADAKLPRIYPIEHSPMGVQRREMMDVEFECKYSSAAEAFQGGFSDAEGQIRLEAEHKISKYRFESEETTKIFPVEFRIAKDRYDGYAASVKPAYEKQDLSKTIFRPDSWLWQQPLSYQRAGFQTLEKVIGELAKVVPGKMSMTTSFPAE